MIKDKLTLTDLASLLADKLELSQKSAEDFVKLFFDSIEENLLANDVVKIKNLGNFKLSWNEARKSVDVNTGDEIVIDGYYKVVFTPDAVLKDQVNQPFAHLEPVVVSQPDLSSPKKSVASPTVNNKLPETPEESVAGLAALNKQADEIKSILSEINSMNGQEETIKETNSDKKVNETLIEAVQEEMTEPRSEEELSAPTTDDVVVEDKLVTSKKTKKKSSGWFWVLALLALIALATYYFKDSLFDSLSTPPSVAVTQQEEAVLADSIVSDTTAVADSVALAPAAPVDSLQLWFDSDRVYNEFIGSVKMSNGNRLTLISLEKYGAKEFWIYIYEANKDKIPNPDLISIGQTLKLPKLPAYVIDVNNPKCVEFAKHLADELKSKGS